MNLTSGTKPTTAIDKLGLSSDDVCAIIKASGDSGVTSLKFGYLQIEFGKPIEQTRVDLVQSAPTPPSNPDTEISDDARVMRDKAELVVDELKTRDDQVAQMLIEDPLRAEQLLLDGELEDDDESDGSERE